MNLSYVVSDCLSHSDDLILTKKESYGHCSLDSFVYSSKREYVNLLGYPCALIEHIRVILVTTLFTICQGNVEFLWSFQ